jgi:hypothetical protein
MDVTIQKYGSAAAYFDLCLDNGLELDDDLHTGQILLIRDELPDTADAAMVAYFVKRGTIITSGISRDQLFEDEFEYQFE